MPSHIITAVLSAVVVLLLLNLVAALIFFSRRPLAHHWLLVILLAGTSGAALAGVFGVLASEGERYADIAVVLTGTAAVTAAVRAGARRRRLPTRPADPDAARSAEQDRTHQASPDQNQAGEGA